MTTPPRTRRMITVFDETGAKVRSITARRGDEERRLKPGWTWREGMVEGRINAAGRRIKLTGAPVKQKPNRITGIPDGATVLVNGVRVTPVDGALAIDVEHEETVRIHIAHPLHEFTTIDLPCRPDANGGGHRVEQTFGRMRVLGYECTGTLTDQIDEIWKLLRGLVAVLTPDQRAALDAGALATMDAIAAVKARIPKPEAKD